MRILLSTAGSLAGPIGGGWTYSRELIRELVSRGHTLHVVDGGVSVPSAVPPTEVLAQLDGVSFSRIDAGVSALSPSSWSARHARPLLQLRDILQWFSPDVVHANGHKGLMSRASRLARVPCVATVHHPGVVCPVGTMTTYTKNRCVRRAEDRICRICYCRQRPRGRALGPILGAVPEPLTSMASKMASFIAPERFVSRAMRYPQGVSEFLEDRRVALDEADLWIAPSRAAGRLLRLNGVEDARVRWVPHGTRRLQRRPVDAGRCVRFGYVGSLSPSKGVDLLMEAFAGRPSELGCELHLFGESANSEEGRSFSERLRSSASTNCTIHGVVSADDLQAAFECFDVLVFPSVGLEIFGLVVLEAHSAGRPVIASRCGGPEDTVRDGVDGLLVPRGDVASLEEAMTSLAESPARVRKLSEGIREIRSMGEHVQDLEGVFQEIRSRSSDR